VIACFLTITNVKTLADRLKFARELRGMSQKELAVASKCAQSAIGNVESGERHTLRNLVIVARALRISADWLYDGKGPKPTKDDWLTGPAPSPLMVAERAKADPWTNEAMLILGKLNDHQRAAAIARLREFVSQLGPPRDGQTLPVAA
jgi:transcriptional regulator with XRE-family HTH domain